MFTFESIEFGNSLLVLVFELFLLLPCQLLIFDQLVTSGLPFALLFAEIGVQPLLLLEKANDSPVVQLHYVIAHFCRHGI